MKNLKRVLSMALATVMLMGTMAVANAADFTDGEDITHVEAVNTMAALNIINGKPDGSYDPQGTVTRAEMAKMLTVALNGGQEPVLGTQTTPKFTDIGGHWAQKYIEYCANLGIISGRGDGTFNPEGIVTGTEAAKMVLVAMGYEATIFKFTGADWAINVNTEANNATPYKLYEGIQNIDPSKGLSRDNAAQLIYNGIQDHMMTKSPDMSITSGEITWKYGKSRSTILNTKYNANVYTAVITANEYASVGGGLTKPGEYRVRAFQVDNAAITNNEGDVISQVMTLKGTATLDMLGKSYKIIVNNTRTGNVYTTVYGEPMLSDMNNIYTVSSDKTSAKDVTETQFKDEIQGAGIETTSFTSSGDHKTPVYVWDAHTSQEGPAAVAALKSAPSVATLKAATANGRVIEVIDNDNDNKVDLIVVRVPAIGQVTAYNDKGTGYITVASKSTDVSEYMTGTKFEKVIGVEDIAKDDFISYYYLNNKFVVNKLESVTGNVTKQTGPNQITVNGEVYRNSALTNRKTDSNADNTLKAATTVGKEVTLYLDEAGYVAYTTGEAAATNYVYVYAVESVGPITGVRARAAFTDGSKAVINIVKVNVPQANNTTKTYEVSASSSALELTTSANTGAGGAAINTTTVSDTGILYKYSENNGEYTLTALKTAEADEITDDKLQQGKAAITDNTLADSKTIFVLRSGNSFTVYTGIAEVPTISSGVNALIAKDAKTDVADLVMIYAGTPSASRSIYILSKDVRVEKNDAGKTIYTVPALVDGEYNEALELSDCNTGKLVVTRGLYTGNKVTLTNGKLSVDSILDGSDTSNGMGTDSDYDDRFFAAPDHLTFLSNRNVTGPVARVDMAAIAGTIDESTVTDTLTVTGKTQFIVIDADDDLGEYTVAEGTIDDLNYDKTASETLVNGQYNYTNNTKIVMTRASADPDEAGFYQAGIVYIVR